MILVPLAWLGAGPPAFSWSVPVGAMLLYAGLPGTALAYWAIAMAGRGLPAVTTSLGLLATPVISIVVATLWLGERPSASLLLAVALILGGVALGASRSASEASVGDRVRHPAA